MIILGVDPGTVVTGYGLLRSFEGRYDALDYGCIRPPASWDLFDRYLVIFEALCDLLQKYAPEVMVVETQFVRHNPQSALKLGMARGAAIIAGRKNGAEVIEYPPSRAKKAVVGNGRASKKQVQEMLKLLLKLSKVPPEDAADALALAMCHAQSKQRRLDVRVC